MNAASVVEIVNAVALPGALGFFGLWLSEIFKPPH